MICRKCGSSNALLKKCCENCGSYLEGYTINNVTGKMGYRNADGSFTSSKTGKLYVIIKDMINISMKVRKA